ncbi:uncharacterized protein LOC143211243 isoform X2 [Lasioglossum baleicum]|uniref:uncharacterized protein LOC143211243 isoform X2 n=1 Tax=Lasioglossum baleicum TaxID=434251 RepID=UPI003FCC9198
MSTTAITIPPSPSNSWRRRRDDFRDGWRDFVSRSPSSRSTKHNFITITSNLRGADFIPAQAIACLETFPSKIIELNDYVNKYMPDSVRNSRYNEIGPERKPKCHATLSNPKDWDTNSTSDYGVSSYYPLSMCDRGGQRHGVCKRRCYRGRGVCGSSIRRRPGPLGQLLAFLVGSLVTCTKKLVITPSQYIIDNMIAAFFQRRELRNAQCGPSPNWDSSLSTYVTTATKDTTIIGNLIDIMRPAMVKLIADTTTMKRWLQSTALKKASSTATTTIATMATTKTTSPPTEELTNAIRRIETIDCWAYELFFHLKYLQVKRSPRNANKVTPEAAAEAGAKPSDVIHANLWHRLVQLRDNYIILYDTLQAFEKVYDLEPENLSESPRASIRG